MNKKVWPFLFVIAFFAALIFLISDRNGGSESYQNSFSEESQVEPSQGEELTSFQEFVSQYDARAEEYGEGELPPYATDLDLAREILSSRKWQWRGLLDAQSGSQTGSTIEPEDPSEFTLAFSVDGTFSGTTDCGSVAGTYKVEEYKIITLENTKFTQGAEACGEDSESELFVESLKNVQMFNIDGEGFLLLAALTQLDFSFFSPLEE